MIESHRIAAEPITGDGHFFFGYYDKHPWNLSGRYHLAQQTPFIDRQPTGADAAVIGVIDTQDGNRWRPLTETTAWCWQQGCMAQWLPSDPERSIIYNIREGDGFRAEIRDIETGETRRLSRAIYAVGPTYALSLNFARLHLTRPGYGYADGAGDRIGERHPDDDGIWRIDLQTGESELIVSLDRLHRFQTMDSMEAGPMWVNHLTWSPEGSNFVFLNRWYRPHPRRPFGDRFFRASADGAELRLVHDNAYFSHFGYYSDELLVGYGRAPSGEDAYMMLDLGSPAYEVLGADVLSSDGHCSFSPDRRWMLTDTYPDADHNRTLILYEMASGRRIDIGAFHSPPALDGPLRCDLHPRWSRDGLKISIDSAQDGARRIYALDVSEITG